MDAKGQKVSPVPVDVLRSENSYTTRSWTIERATRYVFEVSGVPTEASHFGHFCGGTAIKQVIELPLSFGCPVGCRHCATALLHQYRPLSVQQVVEVFRHVLAEHAGESFPRLRISFSGIGEGSLHRDLLGDSCKQIHAYRPDVSFVLTTIGRDASYIGWVADLSAKIPIDYLLVTYLHHDPAQLATIVPSVPKWPSGIDELVAAMVSGSQSLIYRVNYVVMSSFNDNLEHADWLAQKFDGMQERVTFRMSKLNDTPGSKLARLQAPTMDVLQGLRDQLSKAGYSAYCYASHRNDDMNCGQLAGTYQRLGSYGRPI